MKVKKNYIEDKSDLVYDSSTIESVDISVYRWLNETMNLFAETNLGWKKVPVIWVNGERAWQTKSKIEQKDKNDKVVFPVITVERTDISKEKDKRGKYWADIPAFNDEKGGSIAIHKVIKQNKTSNFANAYAKRTVKQPNFKKENKKVVYQTKFVPMPVYTVMTYVIDIKAEYQQQINELMQPFLTFTGATNYFVLKNDGHRYESFIEASFSHKNNVSDLQENERIFNSQLTLKVLGHLRGKSKNDERPKITTRENIVEFKIQREYLIFGENAAPNYYFLDNVLVDENGDYILDSECNFIIIPDSGVVTGITQGGDTFIITEDGLFFISTEDGASLVL